MKCKHDSHLHAKPAESVNICPIIAAISFGSLKRMNRLCSSGLADEPIYSFHLLTTYFRSSA